jgi:transcriptional activator for dhaKLM operon
VRELESVLERALAHSRDDIIQIADLPEAVRQGRALTGSAPRARPVLTTAEAEREAIISAGYACGGHVSDMAQQLGIGRTTLWRKMKRYQINREQFRAH